MSARASLLWGGGFTLLRDAAQFGVMLAMVRLLTPADYGTAALAQAIIGMVSVFSFGTFSGHALQLRDPKDIDWQAHFTSATVINTVLAGLVLLLAFGMSFSQQHSEVALPLAALSVLFLLEIPGTLRHRMLEAHHEWKRYRLLLAVGTVLGLGTGLILALMGGGVWALIVQVPMLGLPAAIDLFLVQRFKPDWRWSWSRYRETVLFGFDRIGSGLAVRGRALNEQVLLSSVYDLATLGIFNRATGLAMLLAGRIGSVVMISLHPVVTRSERGSARFRRLADLVLRGVVWTTVPAAAFLGLAASDVVAILYGEKWSAVAELMPFASIAIGLGGITTSLSGQLVANDHTRAAMWLDVAAAVSALTLAFLLIPRGATAFLAGLGMHGLIIAGAAVAILLHGGALSISGVFAALAPALVACTAGAAAVFTVREAMGTSQHLVVRLAVDASTFAFGYIAALRLGFPRPLAGLLEVAPGGRTLKWALGLASAGS